MQPSRTLRLALALACGAAVAPHAFADTESKRYCSDSLVRGTYAIQLSGTRPAPDGTTESVIGVVVRLYDGNGGVVQVDNVKGSVSGITPNRTGVGTYRVNDDCTVDLEFRPGPNQLLREKAVIMDNGQELRSITVFPPAVMVTATHKKI